MTRSTSLPACSPPPSRGRPHHPDTHRLASTRSSLDDLGELEVKGKTEPVHAYRVTGRQGGPGAEARPGAHGVESAMVGRDAELEAAASTVPVVSAGRGRSRC